MSISSENKNNRKEQDRLKWKANLLLISEATDIAVKATNKLSNRLKEESLFIEDMYAVNRNLHRLWKLQDTIQYLLRTYEYIQSENQMHKL